MKLFRPPQRDSMRFQKFLIKIKRGTERVNSVKIWSLNRLYVAGTTVGFAELLSLTLSPVTNTKPSQWQHADRKRLRQCVWADESR